MKPPELTRPQVYTIVGLFLIVGAAVWCVWLLLYISEVDRTTLADYAKEVKSTVMLAVAALLGRFSGQPPQDKAGPAPRRPQTTGREAKSG